MSATSPWPAQCRVPALGAGDVHVWSIALETTPARRDALDAFLSSEERARAARFRFPHDRDRFVVGHGELRVLLGAYLHRAPGSLRFRRGPYGKPSLECPRTDAAVTFGYSHSAQYALCAVARDLEVGVDIEYCRDLPALGDVAKRLFSPREAMMLERVPEARRLQAFYACWCRKEAYLKARGVGLSTTLDTFDVSLAPGEPPAVLATRDDPSPAESWMLRHLAPAPSYVGALAAQASTLELSCWRWPGGGAVC